MKPNEFKKIPLNYLIGTRTEKQMFDNSWEVTSNLVIELSNGDTIVIPKGF